MEKYYRKILLKNVIQVIDTDGDGTGDSLVFLPKEPSNIQFTLIQSIDDMGLYNEYVETEEEIDLGGIWNTGNNGTGDITNVYQDPTLILPIGTSLVVSDGPLGNGNTIIEGCTDPLATNYDPNANTDNGNCLYPAGVVYGCTDNTADNYNSSATHGDGSCTYSGCEHGDCNGNCKRDPRDVCGCTDRFYLNFDARADTDDGSCTDCEHGDCNGNCKRDPRDVCGCTDSTAPNFDARADTNDGSCDEPFRP